MRESYSPFPLLSSQPCLSTMRIICEAKYSKSQKQSICVSPSCPCLFLTIAHFLKVYQALYAVLNQQICIMMWPS